MATHVDLFGLSVAVAVGALLSALGIGIDSLLLTRHVSRLNELSIRWWIFFEELRIVDIPRIAIGLYLRGKNKILGESFRPLFFARAFAMSAVLTLLTVPGGRSLGLFLVLKCNALEHGDPMIMPISQIIQIGWSWTGHLNLVAPLVFINMAFDFATIFVTILLLSKSLAKSDYFLLLLIALDVLACVVLLHNAIFIADRFDQASTIATEGYWRVIPALIEASKLGCSSFHFVVSKLLFVSTILLPTAIYLLMIMGLFFLRESFKLLRWIAMYVLEKSAEDKKTIFAHVGVSLGLFVAVGKCCLEIAKAVA